MKNKYQPKSIGSSSGSNTTNNTIRTTFRIRDIMDYAFPDVETLMEIAKKDPGA
ncbi:MAG: hypothetical protein ACI82A_004324, partial [Candidatus Azotimanducaceae bacterium]